MRRQNSVLKTVVSLYVHMKIRCVISNNHLIVTNSLYHCFKEESPLNVLRY